MSHPCPASAFTPRTSRSRPAACWRRCRPPRPRASTLRCARTTSRPGASARASPASRGRGWAPRCRPRASRSGASTRPGQRYHPAIIAQATATLAEMYPGRFWVALGSGEASNEHITGEPWPDKAARDARLRECVESCARCSRGEVVDHHGLVTVDRARLWTLPAQPPNLIAAAVSAETAGWAAGGPTGSSPSTSRATRCARVLGAFREGGGEGKPVFLQVHLSWARERARRRSTSPTTSGARTCSSRRSRWDLQTVEAFDEAARASCGRRTCAPACSCPPTSAGTAAWLQEFAEPRLRRRSTSTTWGRSSSRSSTRSGSTCSRSCDEGKATSDLWWKSAVLYCLDVETFLDSNGDGCGDIAGLTERHRLPRRARRLVPLADAVLSLAAQGRRLRHHRLLRRRPAAGHARRPGRARAHGARPRHSRDRRPGREPHFRPAPVVPGGALRPRLALPRLLRVGGREAAGEAGRRRLPRQGGLATGRTTGRPASTTCTASTRTSPTSTSPTRRSATRSPRSSASGSSRA